MIGTRYVHRVADTNQIVKKRFKLRGFFYFIFPTIAVLASCTPLPDAANTDHPNIIIILADDLGYGDLEVYNTASKIPTPHLNQLAHEGMRFTDAHSPSSVCSPTRYGLLTGRYAWRTELKKEVLWAWDKPLIGTDRLTIPKMLKSQGYSSAIIGKWHLGWRWPALGKEGFVNDTLSFGNHRDSWRADVWQHIDFSRPLGGGPLDAGFNHYYGDDVPNFPPYAFIEDNRLLLVPNSVKPDSLFGTPGPMVQGWRLEHVMPAITDKAIDYIHKQSERNSPFFLYFSLTAPHTPIAPATEFQGKSEAGFYGDFVYQVDSSVGQIVTALRETDQYSNTLIFFTSDNGSPQRDGTNMSGQIASVKRFGHDPSQPWRGMKADIWEGGHRVPLIATWPEKIAAGSVSDHLICLTDIAATIAGILDISEETRSSEDSYDFSFALMGNGSTNSRRESIVHHAYDGTFAIRQGNWKLILGKDSGGFSRNIPSEHTPVKTDGQLYNLAEDPGERHNVYATHPDKVAELAALLEHIKNQ